MMGKVKDLVMEHTGALNIETTKAPMPVKIKRFHTDAVVPAYAKPGDAGLDLTAIDDGKNISNKNGFMRQYRTGVGVSIPEGYVGLLFPRSSIYKHGLSLTNCVGVIDSGYRGEILFNFRIESQYSKMYQKGDRIGQMIIMPYPLVEFQEVEELDETERGDGGFGSSGN
jgi:dUTP pyrophosphatase